MLLRPLALGVHSIVFEVEAGQAMAAGDGSREGVHVGSNGIMCTVAEIGSRMEEVGVAGVGWEPGLVSTANATIWFTGEQKGS
eukprot:jgi/Ulvmu1/12419/UM009_0069.1